MPRRARTKPQSAPAAMPPMPGGSFAANLKTAREHAGLSREALAESAGLNPATIYRLEAGDRQPRLPTIIVMGEVLGMTASEMVANL